MGNTRRGEGWGLGEGQQAGRNSAKHLFQQYMWRGVFYAVRVERRFIVSSVYCMCD
jgi:hypothetical protein